MQVYRATLAPQYGGGEVAVKVQRPRLREAIALDLFLMRRLALYVRVNVPSVGICMLIPSLPVHGSFLLHVLSCHGDWFMSLPLSRHAVFVAPLYRGLSQIWQWKC